MALEIWMDIPGSDGKYRVSSLGQAYSVPRRQTKGGILAGTINTTGYRGIRIRLYGTYISMRIHRLVAITFLPNPDNLPEVNHKNGNKLDNRVENLEWCTRLENQRHASSTGLVKINKGLDHGRCRIPPSLVLEIFNSEETDKTLSEKYSVSQACVSKIKTGRTWGHLTGKKHNKKHSPLSKKQIENILSSQETRYKLAKKHNVTWAAINNTIKRHLKNKNHQ